MWSDRLAKLWGHSTHGVTATQTPDRLRADTSPSESSRTLFPEHMKSCGKHGARVTASSRCERPGGNCRESSKKVVARGPAASPGGDAGSAGGAAGALAANPPKKKKVRVTCHASVWLSYGQPQSNLHFIPHSRAPPAVCITIIQPWDGVQDP